VIVEFIFVVAAIFLLPVWAVEAYGSRFSVIFVLLQHRKVGFRCRLAFYARVRRSETIQT
jgi:ABC-type transport system involved in cytochrome c biogenesis permease subunit